MTKKMDPLEKKDPNYLKLNLELEHLNHFLNLRNYHYQHEHFLKELVEKCEIEKWMMSFAPPLTPSNSTLHFHQILHFYKSSFF